MHNIGSTQTEFPNEITGFEAEQFEYQESLESGFEFEQGLYENYMAPEVEAELAAELLSVTNEAEMDYFLGDLLKGAGKALGSFIHSPIARQIGGMLKNVAKTALPMVGSALGNLVLPGIGGVIGGKLAGAAGSALGLEAELEGLSAEDREFEVARKVVELGNDALRHAAHIHHTHPHLEPSLIARHALTEAAKKHAPGLLAQLTAHSAAPSTGHPLFGMPSSGIAQQQAAAAPTHPGAAAPAPGRPSPFPAVGLGASPGPGGHPHRRHTGRWIRRGHAIIVLGV